MSNPWEIQTVEYDKTNAEGNVEVSGYGQISILLNKYVLKEKGKGLSSNDFTDNDVQKLKSIEVGAETNKLETLTINGGVKIYPNDEKNINLPIATKVSQLDNDLGYAKLINMSHNDDFSDSYVGKAKFAFQDEENIAIGKNSNVEHGGIAIGKNTATSETYDINIGNELLHNKISDIWEGKTSSSLSADVAMKNTNGTNLTQLDVVIEDLATETQNRNNADVTLQNNINAETQNRIDADNSLSNDINTEAGIRQNADDLLASDISNVSSRITSIEDKIPSQASLSNQLADKSFVNSSIQTNTANFRGNWNTWSDVPSDDVDLYPQDYAGNRIPTVNDYLVVENASDYTANTLSGTWRFKYGGVWETDGKNGWIPEYQVNEEPLTSEQVYAINSGITSDKVSSYDAHLIDTSNPHSVTKSQVGLGDVINSGDSAIPIEGGTTKFTTGGAFTELAKKVDKVEGKGLSTNDFTDTYKNKLDNIDNVVTDGSENIITSGAVFTAISNITSSNVTGVKGEAESTYRGGNVNITKSNLGLTTDEMGMKWSDSNITSGDYNTPYYANGIWVIGRATSGIGIKYSTDGKTWVNSNITSGNYSSPYYANGIWVIGTNSDSGIKYSTDGKIWTDSNITSGDYNSPYYANGIWVIGGGAIGASGIKYSTDGKTWSDSNITSGYYKSPYYANGIWVIGCDAIGIKYSTDGKTWTNSNITSGSYNSPYYANGIWVIGSGGSGIKYSTDGKTWSDSNITSGDYNTPYYANGIWVIGSASISSGIKYSTDGKTWSDSNITSGYYKSPYYANGIWVIGSNSDSGIKYSTDGKTWSDSNITSGDYKSPYYANGIWVISGDSVSGIKYSTFNSLNDLGSAFKGISELKSYTDDTFATKSYVNNHTLFL